MKILTVQWDWVLLHPVTASSLFDYALNMMNTYLQMNKRIWTGYMNNGGRVIVTVMVGECDHGGGLMEVLWETYVKSWVITRASKDQHRPVLDFLSRSAERRVQCRYSLPESVRAKVCAFQYIEFVRLIWTTLSLMFFNEVTNSGLSTFACLFAWIQENFTSATSTWLS